MKPTILTMNQIIELFPTAPFNFDATFYKPDHFPSGDNDWQPGKRWQTMHWDGKYLGLIFTNKGTINYPKIILTVWSQKHLNLVFLNRLIKEIEYRCNLNTDLTKFYSDFETDPNLSPIINRWYGMRPANYRSLYEYLIITIMLQNCTVQRSARMLEVLFKTYGKMLSFNGKTLFGFWDCRNLNNVTEQELRDLKIGYRAKTIKRISASFANKDIDEFILRTVHVEKQKKELLRLYGVGPASVGYIMFDIFKNQKDLYSISPWELKIYSKLFFDTDPDNPASEEILLKYIGERYKEYKMLAVHYFWEDIFWRRKNHDLPWLEKLIKL